jgi:hypothetical protein
MSSQKENPGQQNQNPGQKPGQQQGGGQKPGQQRQEPDRQGQKPGQQNPGAKSLSLEYSTLVTRLPKGYIRTGPGQFSVATSFLLPPLPPSSLFFFSAFARFALRSLSPLVARFKYHKEFDCFFRRRVN